MSCMLLFAGRKKETTFFCHFNQKEKILKEAKYIEYDFNLSSL